MVFFCSLFSVPPAVASGSSSLPPAAPLPAPPSFSLSGFAALGWGSAPAVLVGWSLPQVPQPSFFHLFSVSDPHFYPVPAPNPLGSAASASAHGLSGVQYTASSSASGLLALFLSACSLVITSACCSFRDLFCSSLSAFGYPSAVPFAPSWRLLRLPWRWLQILRLGCLLPFLAPFVLPLTSCAFCCLNSSLGFWLVAVSSSFSCAFCVVLSR